MHGMPACELRVWQRYCEFHPRAGVEILLAQLCAVMSKDSKPIDFAPWLKFIFKPKEKSRKEKSEARKSLFRLATQGADE